MAKLFPPIIEGSIPAFYENGTVKITVPFSLNRAVSPTQISSMVLKIKTVQNNTYIADIDALDIQIKNIPYYATFDLTSYVNKLKVGQFYKVQIAFKDNNNNVGYYSTTGITKFTTKPVLGIYSLEASGKLNSHLYDYMGEYSQEDGDTTEIVDSYRFKVWNSENDMIADSGWLLHNSSNDEAKGSSYDNWMLSQDLEINKRYYIQYLVKTNNGLIEKTPRYRIMQKTSINPELDAKLNVSLNFENGYIDIDLIGTKDQYEAETPVTGAFLLSRASKDTNYTVWDELYRFKLQAQNPSRKLFRDFTIEQGKTYRYSIQQYNDNNLYSNRMLSEEIYADFEHAFLYDGKRQLKIKFNPKVSSFKPVVMESKIDTIGSKHPFIFRNGRVYYREFPISGLISYLSDEENLFLTKEEFMVEEKTMNLTGNNIQAERTFKMEALKWLTDGEPKIFRSPGEGNFIVRLMNSSLSPNDPTGRMIHTFNTTAYEIADFNYKELNNYGFITIENPNVEILHWKSVSLREIGDGQMIDRPITTARFEGLLPGTVIYLTLASGKDLEIQIGTTGTYYADFGEGIVKMQIESGSYLTGQVTYSYYTTTSNIFNTITNIKVDEIPVRQFIGKHDIIQEITCVQDKNAWVSNNKIKLIEFYNIYAEKRYIHKLSQEQFNQRVAKNTIDPFYLYAIGVWMPGESTEEEFPNKYPYRDEYFKVNKYIDGATLKEVKYDPTLKINGGEVSLEEIENFNMFYPGKISSLSCGTGVVLTCAYQTLNIDFSIEDDDGYPEVREAKEKYDNAVEDFQILCDVLDEKTTSDKFNIETAEVFNHAQLQDNEAVKPRVGIARVGVSRFSTEVDSIIRYETACRNAINSTYLNFIIALNKAQILQKELLGLL